MDAFIYAFDKYLHTNISLTQDALIKLLSVNEVLLFYSVWFMIWMMKVHISVSFSL